MGKVKCLLFCRRKLLTRRPGWLDAEQRFRRFNRVHRFLQMSLARTPRNPKIHQRPEGKQKYVWHLALPFLEIMRLFCAAADHRKSSQKMRQLFREAAPVEQCGTHNYTSMFGQPALCDLGD